MAHVRCMWGPDDCRWYGIDYDDRWIIKRLPLSERTWNRNIRAWVTPVYLMDTVQAWLESAGYDVAIVDVSRPIPQRDWHALRVERTGNCPNRHHAKKPKAQDVTADEDWPPVAKVPTAVRPTDATQI